MLGQAVALLQLGVDQVLKLVHMRLGLGSLEIVSNLRLERSSVGANMMKFQPF